MSVFGAFANAPVSVKFGAQATLRGGSLNDAIVDEGGNLVGAGTVGNVTNNGYVCPDLVTGPWTLKVTGGFTQTATGNLNVDIGSAAKFGSMQVTGPVNLGGDLHVSLQGGYAPSDNQTFSNVITAGGGLTGTFDRIIGNGSLNTTWVPIYTANSLSLRAVVTSN